MTKSFTKFRPRILFISSIVILLWSGLTMRFFYIQVIRSADLREMGLKQGQNKVILPSVRGSIKDRNFKPFAENVIHYSFGINPTLVENEQIILDAIVKVTGQSREYYHSKFSSTRSFEFLERNLKSSISNSLFAIKDNGFVINKHGYRIYPQGSVGSQIIGFTDVDNNGLSGIELEMDKHLKGRDGWIILQTDGRGRSRQNSGNPRQSPVDGSTVILTIDIEYQSILRDEISKRVEKTGAIGGMGIIIEPFSGKILAMTSFPDFDPNNRHLYKTEAYRNRVITDQFEPGSTFKIVPAVAALTLNCVSLNEEFNCGFGQYNFRGHVINDWKEFGLLTFPQIIENSSNVGIIKIAEAVGANNLHQFVRKFGFGSLTGIQSSGESKGVIKSVSEWSAISLAEISLGHEVSVTTLQLAYAYGAIANGGFLMKPLLVEEIIHPSGRNVYKCSPQIVRQIAPKKVMDEMSEMLVRVVNTGTGTWAKIKGWNVAGKTGTAQKFIDGEYSKTRFITSFAGFFPAHNPQLVGVIILEEPKIGYHWGSVGAAPLFKNVMKRIIQMDDGILVHKPKLDEEKIANDFNPSTFVALNENDHEEKTPVLMTSVYVDNSISSENSVVVPNVRGMSMRKAIMVIRNAGLRPKISGSGAVRYQSPRPGTVTDLYSFCILELK